MTKLKPNHYVDNRRLFEVLVEYKNAVAKAKASDSEIPPIPEYIGECILLIAQRLSNKPNFAGYSFKEDMVSDAVENCINYLLSFNPEKSNNPFAYYTQFCQYAFIRRIERERRQVYIKYKYAEHQSLLGDDFANHSGNEDSDVQQSNWLRYDNIVSFIRDYETNKDTKKQERKLRDQEALEDDDVEPKYFDIISELDTDEFTEDSKIRSNT